MADDLGLDPSVGAIMNDRAIDQRAESGDRLRVFAVVERDGGRVNGRAVQAGATAER